MKQGDGASAIDCLKLFPEAQRWIACAVAGDLPEIAFAKEGAQSPAAELLSRKANDHVILTHIKRVTGLLLRPDDLLTHSIPYYMKDMLFTMSSHAFEPLATLKLFSINDPDRYNDILFADSFFAIFAAVSLFGEKQPDRVDQLLTLLEASLANIKHTKPQQRAVEEVFASLFAQNTAGDYACSTTIAERIATIMLMFTTEPSLVQYLKTALKKLQYVNLISAANDFKLALVPFRTLLDLALFKHDWPVAEQMCQQNPDWMSILRPFKEVSLYVSDHQLPSDWKSCAEIGLSYPDESTLLEKCIANVSPNVATVCQKRLDAKDPFKATKGASKWLAKAALAFTRKTPDYDFRVPDGQLKKCTNVRQFCQYLSSFIPLMQRETAEEALQVLPKDAVLTLLRDGSFVNARLMADLFHVNIEEVVLLHPEIPQNDFVANNKSVNAALKIKNGQKCHESAVLQRLDPESFLITGVRQEETMNSATIEEADNSSQSGARHSIINDHLRRALNAMNVDAIADLSFRVPEFDLIVTEFIQRLDLSKLLAALQNSACSQILFDRVSAYVDAKKVGVQPFPAKIALAKLLEIDELGLAQRYIQIFGGEFQVAPILRAAVLKKIHLNASIDEILDLSPADRKEIVKSLPDTYHVKDNITHFEDYVPPDWVIAPTPVDTIMFNLDDTNGVKHLLSEFSSLDIDKQLVSFVRARTSAPEDPLPYRIAEILTLTKRFVWLMRRPSDLIENSCRMLYGFIENTTVFDAASESVAVVHLTRIAHALRKIVSLIVKAQIKSPFCNGVTASSKYATTLKHFAKCYLSSRFEIGYNFAGFQMKDIGLNFSWLAFKYDCIDVADEIRNAWSISDSEAHDDYAKKCYSIGATEDALRYAEDRRHRISKTTSRIVQDYISRLTHARVFDSEVVSLFNSGDTDQVVDSLIAEFTPRAPIKLSLIGSLRKSKPQLETTSRVSHFYRRICDLVSNKTTPQTNSDDLLAYLQKAPIVERIKLKISDGEINESLALFDEITSADEKWITFRHGVFEASIYYDHWDKMKAAIDKSGRKKYAPFLEKLCRHAIKSQIRWLEYDLECYLGRTDEAAVCAIRIFTSNPDDGTRPLDMAMAAATKELEMRQNGRKSCQEVIARKVVLKIAELIPLQKRFTEFIQRVGIPSYDLTIFGEGEKLFSVSNVESMVVLTMRWDDVDLGMELMTHFGVKGEDIGPRLIDIMVNEKEEDVIALMKSIGEQAPMPVFKGMVTSMLTRIFYVHGNSEATIRIIRLGIVDARLKCLLLLHFGDIEGSAAIAKQNRLVKEMPIIGHIASLAGMLSLADDISKLIEKELK